MKIKHLILSIILLCPLTVFAAHNVDANKQQTEISDKKPLYWVDTMEPDIHYSAPGKSRMGMELVPVYPKEETQKNN